MHFISAEILYLYLDHTLT